MSIKVNHINYFGQELIEGFGKHSSLPSPNNFGNLDDFVCDFFYDLSEEIIKHSLKHTDKKISYDDIIKEDYKDQINIIEKYISKENLKKLLKVRKQKTYKNGYMYLSPQLIEELNLKDNPKVLDETLDSSYESVIEHNNFNLINIVHMYISHEETKTILDKEDLPFPRNYFKTNELQDFFEMRLFKARMMLLEIYENKF